jgi:uncharacterized protein (TIGR02145 family)
MQATFNFSGVNSINPSIMFPLHHTVKSIAIALLSILSLGSYSQTISLSFSFNAENNGQYTELTGVKAVNLTHDGETIITFPVTTMILDLVPGDTILFIGYSMGFPVGIQDAGRNGPSFSLSQTFPNPTHDQSQFFLFLPEAGTVTFIVSDFQGSRLMRTEQKLVEGIHSYRFSPAACPVCFLTAQWQDVSRSIKIINTGSTNREDSRLEYLGTGGHKNLLKTTLSAGDLVEQESGILDTPTKDRSYTFQYAYNIPCPGTPSVSYLGRTYTTVQIFSQCWLKENLNVGTMLEICADQTDNGYLEKYCYSDNEDSCSKYGGLYQWDEMMQYTTMQGGQGICPPGWHVPTADEWSVLMGIADSHYGIGDTIFNVSNYSGFDSGTNLKSKSGWASYNFGQNSGNGTDLIGFTGLPGGFRDFYGCSNYSGVTAQGFWWTSTENSLNAKRVDNLRNNYATLIRNVNTKRYGYSVRCMKDPG